MSDPYGYFSNVFAVVTGVRKTRDAQRSCIRVFRARVGGIKTIQNRSDDGVRRNETVLIFEPEKFGLTEQRSPKR